MPQKESKKNVLFNWLAKGTRAEPWPPSSEIIDSDEFKNLQKIGKELVEKSKKEKAQ
ncbi:MAG: hypothetical protein OXK80_02345 [Bdellovibrionales bacterium]|nr:hypothetical protein [Bdellovibrionales bacterium]